jgi:hypothetical protein
MAWPRARVQRAAEHDRRFRLAEPGRSECGRSPDSAVFTLDFIDLGAQTWSFVLQAPEAVTKSVPFTVRARLVAFDTK